MDDGGGAAASVLPFFFLIVGFAVWVLWLRAMRHGMRPRTVDTALSPDELRQLFADTVVTWSWNLEDEGNPMVARSSLLTGFQRQRIALTVSALEGRTQAVVEVASYEGQWLMRVPKSPYTLLWRIDSFLKAVRELDPSASVSG